MAASARNAAVLVIVPVSDAAPCIAATLDSLGAQSFADWTCVVVDDGSQDDTAAVAEVQARRDGRIAVHRQPRQGMASARNSGLALGRGDRVLFLDAGEGLDPGHLAALHAASLRHRHADVVYCDWRLVSSGGRTGPRRRADLSLDPAAAFAGRCAMPLHAALLRRPVIEAAGAFDPSWPTCEDWEFWQRIAGTGAVFRRVPDIIAGVRVGSGLRGRELGDFLTSALALIRRKGGAGLAHAEAAMALTVAGQCVGARRDAVALLASCPFDPDPSFDAASAADSLLDGIPLGSGDARPDWAAVWPGLRVAAQGVLEWIGGRIAMPDFARLALRELDLRIAAEAGGDCDIGAVSVRQLGLDLPATGVVLPECAERLIGIVERDRHVLGRFSIAAAKGVGADRIAGLLDEFRADAPEAAPEGSPERGSGQYWEDIFATEDPWTYDNPYETLKYEQTLDAVAGRPRRALELACAEGHFTRRLAGRVGQLLATDISPTAVSRAGERCGGLTNVSFGVLDMIRDPLPGGMDLILCCEVLYYVDDADELALLADRIADALAPEGRLVMAHANLRGDGGGKGFDWPHRFGAVSIGAIFGRAKGLELVEERASPLYRISVFRRRDSAAAWGPVTAVPLPVADTLPEHILAHFDWGGRVPARFRRTAPGVPILMYHRIAEDPLPALGRYATTPAAFGAQMEWLRSEGYAAITAEDFASAIWQGAPLPERPVVVSFDDAYRDNLAHAVPVLKRLEMTATIFVPTGHVGGAAAWDTLFGPPAPLMTWEELALVRDAGLGLSSHGVSHRPMTALTLDELKDEAQRSHDALRERLGVGSATFAYPYGIGDEAVGRALLDEGYLAGFTTESRRYRPGDKIMKVPRIEVRGGMSLEAFAAAVEAA
ncbi:MAG: glycosyltransferase [Paracoccaceae bacterium]